MWGKKMRYGTILIDPPWAEYGGGRIKRGANRHYPLMSEDEIRRLLINYLIDEQRIGNPCHCYLWVTNNFLEAGLRVLRAIGFTYKTNLVWVKDRFGLGQYFRGQHELCLFGTFGKVYLPTDRRQSTVIVAPRRHHSQKPDLLYTVAEKISPKPHLELFARNRRKGWDAIGDI
jgi:N6-adenosine-specific RNA methylase IME4